MIQCPNGMRTPSTHPLLLLHFVAELSPRVRLATQRHVAWEGTFLLLHHADLEEADEGDDLEEPKSRDLRQRGQAVRHVSERNVRGGREHAGQAEVLLDEVASDGQHRNASVLDLDVPEAVEPGRNQTGNSTRVVNCRKLNQNSKATTNRKST